MLWAKAFHIIFVVSWFAGLFYLPRIFVNLAQVNDAATTERLLLMAHKLRRFTALLGWVAVALGVALLFLGHFKGGWLHAKLALVVLLIGYEHYCAKLLRDFQQGRNTRSHVWYRWFNEIPTVLLFAIVLLVVVKPF